jgi:four helix bundle protein
MLAGGNDEGASQGEGSKMAQNYKDLLIWKKAMVLVADVYKVSRLFPKDETYGLTSQIRRSAVSVPSNIAEGKGRRSAAEFQQFLVQARGSLYELETQIQIAGDLEYINHQRVEELKAKTAEIAKMINALLEFLKRQKQLPTSKT